MADPGSNSGTPRPRRSTRVAVKTPVKTVPAESSPSGKRKRGVEKATSDNLDLEQLLTNSKSKLTNIDISDLINYSNFLSLSDESQRRLCELLPPTAFSTFKPGVSATHPDAQASTQDVPATSHQQELSEHAASTSAIPPDPPRDLRGPVTLDPAIFTSPFFISAAHTFQDQLFASWFGPKAVGDLQRFQQGTRNGTIHAQWKDQSWAQAHAPRTSKARRHVLHPSKPRPRDLSTLAKQGVLQSGDVLAYRRRFGVLGVTIEKDLLIHSIHPHSHALTLYLAPRTRRALPAGLVAIPAKEADMGEVLAMDDVRDVVALERGVLDTDGRVSRADQLTEETEGRPAPAPHVDPEAQTAEAYGAMRAWKAFTLWRCGAEEVGGAPFGLDAGSRGRRQIVSTLFYLAS